MIVCRKEDEGDIKKGLKELEQKYTSYMKEQTERDEYVCSLEIMSDYNLTDDKDMGCGGVILYTENKKIVCPNMLHSRLNLALEEMLPEIRNTLFPA